MTVQKKLKQHIRARMERTGESYSSARRHLLHSTDVHPKHPWHFPGNIAGPTALRSLLSAAGVVDLRTTKPFSEALLFGIAGGIGIGVFAFCYEKEDFASFFVGGRHLWHDDVAYFDQAFRRFGIEPTIRESTSGKAADKALREAVMEGPCIAWVDMACLPHRAMPELFKGGGYHVVSVYGIEDDGSVLIGDLTDEPIVVEAKAFAEARGRIRKFKNRLLCIPTSKSPQDLSPLIRDGLAAGHRGLTGEGGVKNAKMNFSLGAIRTWAERIGASKGRDSWAEVFPRGHRLWNGLISITQFVEYWGGGGLARPLFAVFLKEAEEQTADKRLGALSAQYQELGHEWTALADAALPSDVPAFREARELYARKSELTNSGGSIEEVRSCWARLDELALEAKQRFPLSESQTTALLADLQGRVQRLFVDETAAHLAMAAMVD